MKILICSATGFELNAVYKQLFPCELPQTNEFVALENLDLYFSVTGIGPMVSAADTARLLALESFDAVIDIGICGSFRDQYPVGAPVFVQTEAFADFGVDNHGTYETAFESGVMRERLPFSNGKLHADQFLASIAKKIGLPLVNGLTVGVATGSESRIAMLTQKFDADIESMEGASVYYACNTAKVACAQIRTVSNLVTPRNKENWDIPTALKSLGIILQKYLEELSSCIQSPDIKMS